MYLIYGAGQTGNKFLNKCKEKEIEEIILTDSNAWLWGKKINGFEVINPEDIEYKKIKLAIVATQYVYYEEIKEYLLTRVGAEKIAYYSDVLLFTPYDRLNLGSIVLQRGVDFPGIYKEQELISCFDEQSFNDLDRFFYQSNHRVIHKVAHYTEAYERFFTRYRNREVKVLEIGVFKGGSLQMWKHYFGEKAEIIGVDINSECKKYEETGIKIYIGDQENKEFLQLLKKELGKVDIIIDDGGHTMRQQIVSFEELFDMLNEDGVYLCEDVHTSYWGEFGGGYKKVNTFIEYSKEQIDGLNEQYFDSKKIFYPYRGRIKSITYYDGMVFIEKKKFANKSPIFMLGGEEYAQ